jgi:hypothetical protein
MVINNFLVKKNGSICRPLKRIEIYNWNILNEHKVYDAKAKG